MHKPSAATTSEFAILLVHVYIYLIWNRHSPSPRLFYWLPHCCPLVMSYRLRPGAKCPAAFPGYLVPSMSSGSLSLCTFFLLCCQNMRLVIQSGWKAVNLADKALAKLNSSPVGSICVVKDLFSAYQPRTFVGDKWYTRVTANAKYF